MLYHFSAYVLSINPLYSQGQILDIGGTNTDMIACQVHRELFLISIGGATIAPGAKQEDPYH